MQFITIGIIGVVSLFVSLAPLHAQTQSAMNAQARAEFRRADVDLNKTYQSVLAKLPTVEGKQKLREAQRAWVVSRDAEAARAAKEADGGSVAPTLRYGRMARLTRDRINELNNMVDHGTQNAGKLAASNATASPSSAPESTSEQAQSVSETGRSSLSSASSISPDKKWEYECEECSAALPRPQIVKAGTSQRVVDLNKEVPDGVNGIDTEVVWAPDSKRFAFNYGTQLTHHSYRNIAFYQLRGDKWEALVSLVDGLADQVYPRQCDPYQGEWQLRNWTDPNTAILYAACPGKRESAFLLTLKFDDAGNWKLTKSHRMSDKEVKKREKEQ
jgi:uncharacterized protein YecT (DUF1311 family)